MSFTVRLDKSYKLIAAVLGAAFVGAVFVWVAVSNFIVRVVADPRVQLTSEALLTAASRFPNSPRVNFRLADTAIADATSTGQLNTPAEVHAMRAVYLSPWDYRARRLLAIAQEINEKTDEAELSLREAVKFAPNHAELNWAFANLLLRRGKLDESFRPFQVATASAYGTYSLLPTAIDLVWQSSGGSTEKLKLLAGSSTEAQLMVAKFLTEQNLIAEAVAVFNAIDKQARMKSPRGPELIGTLIKAGQIELARSVWLEMVTALTPTTQAAGNLMWNGGFETDAVKNFDHFDWVLTPNKYARIAVDRDFARTGARSLRISFSGLDTTTLRSEVRQSLNLKPNTRYRLECYVKSSDLITPEGPRISVVGPSGVIAMTEPVKSGSTEWQRLAIDFVAPVDASSAVLTVVRIPKFSYDDPTKGTVWFDDFTLVEQ